MKQTTIFLSFLLLLVGCNGGATAVLPTTVPQQQATVPILTPGATAVAPSAPPTNTPAGNETAVPPTAAAPLTMETVAAQTRIAEQTDQPLRVNHRAGVQLQLPASWELRTGYPLEYRGREGGLALALWSNTDLLGLDTLEAVCDSDEAAAVLGAVGYPRELVTINGRSVCLMANNGKGSALVAYPTPWSFLFPNKNGAMGPFHFLQLETTSAAMPLLAILETLDFPETPDAAAYLRGVVDAYQADYIFRDQVDFVAWEKEALARLTPDRSLDEVRQLLLEMFDMMRAVTRHDHLNYYSPERVQSQVLSPVRPRLGLQLDGDGAAWLVEPGSPAAAAGMQTGDRVLRINGLAWPQIELRDGENEIVFERAGTTQAVFVAATPFANLLPPNGRLLTDTIAYLELFGFNNYVEAELSRYLTLVHDQIATLDAPNRCWVLDLRRNTGGAKHASMGGIGPFAGNGTLYTDWLGPNTIYPLTYENGRIFDELVTPIDVAPERPYTMINTQHRIAVLVSSRTASGGELSAMVVSTQPENRARIFGEKTVGLSSSVRFFELYDKSIVQIPLTAWVDLAGNRYPEGILPDEPMNVFFDARYGTLDDPVVAAAVAWLENTQDCR